MSVYVKGMKMPESCGECKMHFLSFDSNVCCQITDRIPKIVDRFYDSKTDLDARKKSIMSVIRPEWCPLVDVPTPHGRLIDADRVIHEMNEMHVAGATFVVAVEYVKLITADAPTVIEAEKE